MRFVTLVVLLILAGLPGCNSGSSERNLASASGPGPQTDPQPIPMPTAVHFEGIWQGTATSDVSGTSSPAILMVNGWGEFRMVTDDAQFVGFTTRTASTLEGEVTGFQSVQTTWNDGSRSSRFTLSGTISGDHSIEASYSGNVDSGTLQLALMVDTKLTTIYAVDGVWAVYDNQQNVEATIQMDRYDDWAAQVSGAHANGCTYFGNIEAWTSAFSYDITPFEVTGCPLIAGTDINGTYVGTAALIDIADDKSDERLLVVALSSDVIQITFFLHRIPA